MLGHLSEPLFFVKLANPPTSKPVSVCFILPDAGGLTILIVRYQVPHLVKNMGRNTLTRLLLNIHMEMNRARGHITEGNQVKVVVTGLLVRQIVRFEALAIPVDHDVGSRVCRWQTLHDPIKGFEDLLETVNAFPQ